MPSGSLLDAEAGFHVPLPADVAVAGGGGAGATGAMFGVKEMFTVEPLTLPVPVSWKLVTLGIPVEAFTVLENIISTSPLVYPAASAAADTPP